MIILRQNPSPSTRRRPRPPLIIPKNEKKLLPAHFLLLPPPCAFLRGTRTPPRRRLRPRHSSSSSAKNLRTAAWSLLVLVQRLFQRRSRRALHLVPSSACGPPPRSRWRWTENGNYPRRNVLGRSWTKGGRAWSDRFPGEGTPPPPRTRMDFFRTRVAA